MSVSDLIPHLEIKVIVVARPRENRDGEKRQRHEEEQPADATIRLDFRSGWPFGGPQIVPARIKTIVRWSNSAISTAPEKLRHTLGKSMGRNNAGGVRIAHFTTAEAGPGLSASSSGGTTQRATATQPMAKAA